MVLDPPTALSYALGAAVMIGVRGALSSLRCCAAPHRLAMGRAHRLLRRCRSLSAALRRSQGVLLPLGYVFMTNNKALMKKT